MMIVVIASSYSLLSDTMCVYVKTSCCFDMLHIGKVETCQPKRHNYVAIYQLIAMATINNRCDD